MKTQKLFIRFIFVLFLFFFYILGNRQAKAETLGSGARIIIYGVPEEARFHLGGAVGSSVKLTAEATGSKVLSGISFTSSDTSVCSVKRENNYWLVTRLKEGTSVIRMSCKANQDKVVRTLLMSNLTPLYDDSAEEDDEEEDGTIRGILKNGSIVYWGCSDVEGITSYKTEKKDEVKSDRGVEIVSQCAEYYRVELEDESTFGDSDEVWGYVKKTSVYIPVRRIRMKESLLVYEQNSASLEALVYPRIATNQKINFTTSNSNAVTVDESGTAYGKHRGEAVVTAASAENDSITAKCRLTIKPYVPVTGISIEPQTLEIEDGTAGKITAHVLPEDATETAYSWKVSREDILRMDSKGRYLALKPGNAVVTATSKEGNFSASCLVTVKSVEAKGVFIQSTLSLDIGETKTPVWRMIPSNATNKGAFWKSDNPHIVSVDKSGRLTGVGQGSTNVHITTMDGGFHAVCKVTVEIYVKNIHLNNTSFSMTKGKTKQLRAAITPQNRTKEKLIWRSETPSVATVTSGGWIKATGIGTAKILLYDEYTGAYDYALVHVSAGLKKPSLSAKKKGKKFILSWKKVKQATGYTIYEKKKKTFKKLKQVGSNKTKYTVKKAKKGVKYRIRANYQSGKEKENSPFSKTVTVT